jgi:succinate dehydrogenase / fumarate reductase cytochrome b subunit
MILSGSVILAFWDCILWLLGTRNGLQVRWSESIGFYKILPRTSGEIWKSSPYRNLLCVICSLSLHLLHGFNSSMQSVGFNNKYSKALHKLGYAYAIVIPVGFIFIALFHHFNHIQL